MKKFVFLLFAVLLIFCAASCSKSAQETKSDPKPDAPENNMPESETIAEFDIYSVLPASDFGGNNFNVYVPPNLFSPVDLGFTAEEQLGEKFNDEVYNRNRNLEERYNFKYNMIYGADPWSTYKDVKKILKSGDNTYDIFFTHIWTSVASFASEGIAKDWQEIPYVDLTQSWWNQSSIKAMRIANKVFYAAGSFQVQDVVVLIANKNMVADFALESPYKLVKDGRWTLDNVGAMAKYVTMI